MADLGFSRVELSHGIRIIAGPGDPEGGRGGGHQGRLDAQFLPAARWASFQAAPNFFQPSSPDERERDQWLRQTKRSIDFAAQVGASLLVCHLGSVKYLWLEPDRRTAAYLARPPGRGPDRATRPTAPCWRRRSPSSAGAWPPTGSGPRNPSGACSTTPRRRRSASASRTASGSRSCPLDADFPGFLAGMPAPAACGLLARHRATPTSRRGWGSSTTAQQLEDNAVTAPRLPPPRRRREGNDHQADRLRHVDFEMVRRSGARSTSSSSSSAPASASTGCAIEGEGRGHAGGDALNRPGRSAVTDALGNAFQEVIEGIARPVRRRDAGTPRLSRARNAPAAGAASPATRGNASHRRDGARAA